MARLGMRPEPGKGDPNQYISVRGDQDYRRSNAIPAGFLPTVGTQAPAAARPQAGKSAVRILLSS